MRKLILISVLLTSCATKPQYIVGECPTVKLPIEPHYAIYELRPGDSSSKAWKAYVATVYQQKAWIKEVKIKAANESRL
jgi:hypothetical protein